MATITDNLSALSIADREIVEQWLTFTQHTFACAEARIQEYKKGETSTLKLLNDLESARTMISEASENIRGTVI